MKQKQSDNIVRLTAQCRKEMEVKGIYCDDDGDPYLESEEGIEVPLAQIFSSFRDEDVRIKIVSCGEVPI